MAGYPGLGERIRRLRTTRGITLQQLAERVGLAWETIQRVETDKQGISLENLRKIAEVLGTTSKFLMPDEGLPSDLPPEEADKVYLRQCGFDDDHAREILDFMAFIRQKKQKKEAQR